MCFRLKVGDKGWIPLKSPLAKSKLNHDWNSFLYLEYVVSRYDFLIFNILPYRFLCYTSYGSAKVSPPHKCCPQYRFFNSGNSSCSNRDERPFRYCTILLGAILGGHDSSRCIWSLLILPDTIVIFLASHPWRISSRNRPAMWLLSILYRYFVTQIMWYFISNTAWLVLWYPSDIFSHPLIGILPYFLTSFKAQSVYRLKAVGLDLAYGN